MRHSQPLAGPLALISSSVFLTLLVSVPFLLFPTDWNGWLAAALMPFIFVLARDLDLLTKVAANLCLAVHQIVSFVNAYVVTVPSATDDAKSFHFLAAEMVEKQLPIPWTMPLWYSDLLAFAYKIFGPSLFFGEQISNLAFVLALLTFARMSALLGVESARPFLVLLFGLLPSVVMFTSVTLREPWQIFFLLLSTFAVMRLRDDFSVRHMAFFIATIFGLSLFHDGLQAYALFLVLIGFLWSSGGRLRRVLTLKRVGAAVLALALAFGWIAWRTNWAGSAAATISGNAVEFAASFREAASLVSTRATYGLRLDASSTVGILKSSGPIFMQYMLAPLPHQVQAAIDLYAMLESFLRVILIFFALRAWRRASGELRHRFGFILVIFFSVEFMWALGTLNWGTAIRHHGVAYPLIVLLGGPPLWRFLQKMWNILFAPMPLSRGTSSPARV